MRPTLTASGVFFAAFLACVPAHAQAGGNDPKIDCRKAETQTDLNICAARDFDAADKELNAQYKKTRAAMAAIDADLAPDRKGAEKALLRAQRAWVDYRDGECEAEGYNGEGGTIQPMLIGNCKASLTRARTKELKTLAAGLAGEQ